MKPGNKKSEVWNNLKKKKKKKREWNEHYSNGYSRSIVVLELK